MIHPLLTLQTFQAVKGTKPVSWISFYAIRGFLGLYGRVFGRKKQYILTFGLGW